MFTAHVIYVITFVMYRTVPIYNPLSGHPPVEGQDYWILSRNHVRCRMARHFAAATVCVLTAIGTSFSAGVSIATAALDLPPAPYEPSLPQSGALLAVTAYAFKKRREHMEIRKNWKKAAEWFDNKPSSAQARVVWFNPQLRKGDVPNVDVTEMAERALQTLDMGLIPGFHKRTHAILISGRDGDLRF